MLMNNFQANISFLLPLKTSENQDCYVSRFEGVDSFKNFNQSVF